jgi:hypothetical protein
MVDDMEAREALREQAEAVSDALKYEIANMLDTDQVGSYDNVHPAYLATGDGMALLEHARDLTDPTRNRRLGQILVDDLDKGIFCVDEESNGSIHISFHVIEDGADAGGAAHLHYIDLRKPEIASAVYGDVLDDDFRALCLDIVLRKLDKAIESPNDFGGDSATVIGDFKRMAAMIEESDDVKKLVKIV